jgi:hypothetical protein
VSARVGIALAMLLTSMSAAKLAAQGSIPPDVELEVYATALEFYSPPRGQVRWLESPVHREALIERLGDRFRPWVENAPGSGGRLVVSPIEEAGPDRYRLTVRYRHRTPHFEGPESTQEFLVGCDGARCRILARGPDASADTR